MASKNNLIRFDWAIKRLLRNKADYTVLEGFLSVLLNDDIKIVNINESEGNMEHADDKFNRVDILVENSGGELMIVEVQNSFEVDYLLRMLFGVSKAVTATVPYARFTTSTSSILGLATAKTTFITAAQTFAASTATTP